MADGGLEQSGYIDIKQPPKIKGRKLKTWKKKYVVLQEMSIISADKSAAKVDVYADKMTATTNPADKHTFILEFVTDVCAAKSKNRAHAFEIVEKEAVLLLAGETELETQQWMTAFKNIFWPNKVECDLFSVTIIPNVHTSKLLLEGAYTMNITPEVIGIQSNTHNSYEWSLNMLKRFNADKDSENPTVEVLTIECGPKSECGEATFQFRSERVADILASIKRNIVMAINLKKTAKTPPKSDNSSLDMPWRMSVTSNNSNGSDTNRSRSGTVNSSEQQYRDLLESPAQESKRTRFMSSTSEMSQQSAEQTSLPSPEVNSNKQRPRHSVTFENRAQPMEINDLLSEPIENPASEEDSIYNKVELNGTKAIPAVGNIISTFTVAKPGYQTKVLLDENGYSHVEIKDSLPAVVEEDKTRSLSNISSHSSISCRSASVGSRDSGVPCQSGEPVSQSPRVTVGSRSTHSFDSAVSTSSANDQTEITTTISQTPQLTVDIQEVIVTAAEMEDMKNYDIYQDVSIDESKSDEDVTVKSKHPIKKSNSTGNFQKDKENEYEDLDKFRKGKKDLIKLLGMDPKIDPKSVPPSLPEIPLSYKIKRKFQNQDKKMFTLPFARNKLRKPKDRALSISSSSDSDNESVRNNRKSKNKKLSVKAWPLGNKSVMADNDDIYQPVAIERYLKDDDGNMLPLLRERSSSLNLNMISSVKRPSVSISRKENEIERRSAMWKHNRNVSMHVDLMNRVHDPNTTNFDVTQKFDMSMRPELLGQSYLGSNHPNFTYRAESIEEDHDKSKDSIDALNMNISDDEPIYAEVEPVRNAAPQGGDTDEPFPNLDSWQPPSDSFSVVCNNSVLDATQYENDDSMQSLKKDSESGDVFNQGFVSESDTVDDKAVTEDVLIHFSTEDLSDTSVTTSKRKQSTAADIFNMGIDPLFDQTPMLSAANQSSLNKTTDTFVDIFCLGSYMPQTSNIVQNTNDTSKVMSNENWADFSQLQKENVSDNKAHESIYMDMSVCKNESIYVMPSSLKTESNN